MHTVAHVSTDPQAHDKLDALLAHVRRLSQETAWQAGFAQLEDGGRELAIRFWPPKPSDPDTPSEETE